MGGNFMAQLKPDQVAEVRSLGRRRLFRRGAVICSEGESARWLLILLSGRVKLSSFTDDGTEILLSIRGAGALIGELEATDGKPRPATVTALETVEALVVLHSDFATFLRSADGAMRVLVDTLCERLREAERKRVEHHSLDATRRVVRCLIELADQHGVPGDQGVSIPVALTQDELAAWSGASREAVNKALRSLRLRGWVSTGRRSLAITDLAALRQLAR